MSKRSDKMEIIAVAIGLYALTRLMGDMTPSDSVSEDSFEPHIMYDCKTGIGYEANTQADHDRYASLGYVHNMNECSPVLPQAPTQAGFKIESIYSNGSYTLFCLYQLEGGAYEDPQSGIVSDNTAYNKVGHIVGDPLGTGFISEATGGYDFNLDGVEYKNVRIFTEASGRAYIDSKAEPQEDPLAPEVQPEDETPSPSPAINPTPSLGSSMNGYRRTGIL